MKDYFDLAAHLAGSGVGLRTDVVPDDALKIGSQWFYPMHYGLHWSWLNLGYWLVGLAAFTMLVALVTGMMIAIVGMLLAGAALAAALTLAWRPRWLFQGPAAFLDHLRKRRAWPEADTSTKRGTLSLSDDGWRWPEENMDWEAVVH